MLNSAIGPTIENGFYYDVLFENPISIEDFPVIEKEMKKIIKTGRKIEKSLNQRKRQYQYSTNFQSPIKSR